MKIGDYPIYVLPTFTDKANPARCWFDKQIIEINKQAFEILPEYSQDFVLWHEVGHLKLNTRDEVEADRFALKQLALKKPNSLIHYVESINCIAYSDRRKKCAIVDALQIAADDGSTKAKELLISIGGYSNASGPIPQYHTVKWWRTLLIVFSIILLIILSYE